VGAGPISTSLYGSFLVYERGVDAGSGAPHGEPQSYRPTIVI
jgi:hypothetical protein